jgi:hypothetical protein
MVAFPPAARMAEHVAMFSSFLKKMEGKIKSIPGLGSAKNYGFGLAAK